MSLLATPLAPDTPPCAGSLIDGDVGLSDTCHGHRPGASSIRLMCDAFLKVAQQLLRGSSRISSSVMRKPMSRHRLAAASLLVSLAFTCALAKAAPIDPSEVPAAGSALGLPGGGESLGTGPSGGSTGVTDDTVEMLLRLQKSPGADAGAQARGSSRTSEGVASRSAPAAREAPGTAAPSIGDRSDSSLLPAGVVQELKDLKESVFGSGPEGAGIDDERANLRRGSAGSDDRGAYSVPATGGATGGGTRSAGDSPRASGSGLLANPVVRFIRENRGLSIGASLGLLAAVWLTANYRSRRRR
ncbi:MAG TPA: hypothetical protein PKJ45_10825 [Rubrivivax sp.]|nr:hypothetical protein [Rubrivivax sp.]